jgi:hypothetical protein
VGVLSELGAWSASTRYRALQHVPRLEQQFAEVSVSLPRDAITRPPGRVGQARYFATHARRYVERTVELRRWCADRDALFVQRGLYALGPSVIVKALDAHRGPLVFDLDDGVFHLSPSLQAKSRLAQWLYGPQQARSLLERATAIIVSTPTLADLLPPVSVPVIILPTLRSTSSR